MSFSSLDISFPLFDADEGDAAEYLGIRKCTICGSDHHGFELGVGCAVMVNCPDCRTENGLDADDRQNGVCRQCNAVVPFPDFRDNDEIVACYPCLRSGKAAITTDTELGMISWEQAYEGLTHGIPGLSREDFELVDGDDGWVRARLPQETMFELLRTPNYTTIQGERWQFCCKAPMVFIGQWSRERFNRESEDGNGQALFNDIAQEVVPGLWEDQLHDITGVYVFQCKQCGSRTAHWDIA